MRIQFGSGAYQLGESATFDAQRMVNAYVEPASPGSDVDAYVRQRYGIASHATIGNGPMRGGREIRGYLYLVSGVNAYRVTEAGAPTLLGTIPGDGPVWIRGDETNVAFLASRDLYWWNGTTLALSPDAPTSDWLEYMDGYYIGSNADTGQFFVSGNRDPGTWNALDFASAEKYPDDILTGIVDHGELILFGTASGEIYYNSGNADFPLDKVSSGHFEIGCTGVRSPAKLDNTVFFVGSDLVVYRLNGYVPQRVSTHAIEAKLRAATDKDFIGNAWTEGGHKFYSLSCDDFTLVYDVATQLWHERNVYGYAYWPVTFVATLNTRVFAGSSIDGGLGELRPDTVTDWSLPLVSLATCKPLVNDNKQIEHARLELLFQSGVGTLSEPEPKVMMRFSDDRGRTWSSEKWRRLGSVGEYQTRACWNRLGQARGRIYEYSISSAVPRTLIMATAESVIGGY